MIVHVVIAAMVTVLGGGWDTADLQAPPGGRRLVPALSAPAARDPAGKSLQGHTAPLRENPPPVFKVQIPRLTPGTVFTNARVSRGITFRWPKLASDRLVWGGYRTAPPTGPPTLGYTGHVYDPNAGLVYGKARWYAPELGTWMSEDPVGALANLGTPNGLGAWLYANGNPVRYTDPTGERAATAQETQELTLWRKLQQLHQDFYDQSPGWAKVLVDALTRDGYLTATPAGTAGDLP